MHIRGLLLFTLLLAIAGTTFGQQKFKVVLNEKDSLRDSYLLVDEKGNTLKQLDTSKYSVCFTLDVYGYFAVFGKKDFKGWAAIDVNENILFNVYNMSFGEPNPDFLVENKIRIVDANNKIGFANNRGR